MSNIKICLGIESSCDDTGVAVVTSDRKILSNIVISQNKEHEAFNGVVPEIAARSHMQNLEAACMEALAKANISWQDIDVIAATSGPGLIGGVIVGCMFGKTLSSTLQKPFVAVNHLEGHALTARLTNNVEYPYLLLLASGGHCQFVSVEALGKYSILGQTLDDAVGEAFDKVGKMLGFGFPGGPEIERRAKFGDSNKYKLPKTLVNRKDCDMSFSGLKTAVRLLVESFDELTDEIKNDIAASFQSVVADILSNKLEQAIIAYEKQFVELRNKAIVIAGGVAANQFLRTALTKTAERFGYSFTAPPMNLCTDNAAMIAFVGLERLEQNLVDTLNFIPKARWSLSDL